MPTEISASIKLAGESEFKRAVSSSATALREATSESKLLEEQFKGQQNTMEALQAKHTALENAVAAHQQKEEALANALANAKNTQEQVGAALDELKAKRETESAKLDELKAKYGEASDEVKEQEEKISSLSSEIERGERNYQTATDRVSRWQTQLNNAQAETIRANDALEENSRYLEEAANSADGCATSLDEFGNAVDSSTGEMEESADAASSWADKLQGAIATNLVSAAREALQALINKAKEAIEYVMGVGSAFEAAMSEVEAISGATGSNLDALTAKSKELGSTTKFTATEVANAFQYMSLAGWDTEQMLSSIDGVLNLAAASGMGLADASDMITDYLSAFSMEAEEATYMADMLAYAQANSNTTAEQLGEAYGNCAANLNTAGQDIETVTALLEGMANQGLKGSEAGTALGSIMTQITQKMKDGRIAIGDTMVAVADTDGNFRDLTDILTDVGDALDGMGTEERSAALAATFNKTALSGLNLVLNEGMDKVSDYEDALRDADGAAESMADTMQDNLSGDLTKASSALEGLGIAAYDYVDGPVRSVVQGVTGVISKITDAITPQRDTLQQFTDEIKESNSEVRTLMDSANENMASAESDAAKLEVYKDTLLELNGVTEKTEYQKYQVSQIVSELADSVPQLAAAFDEETGSINLTNYELEQLLDNQEAVLLQEAAMKAMTDSMDALMQAEVNAAKAASAVQEAEEQIAELQEKARNSTVASEYADEIAEWDKKLAEANKTQEEANELAAEAEEDYKATSDAVAAATERVQDCSAELYDMGLTAEETGDATGEMGDEAAEALESTTTAAEEAAEAFETMKDSIADSIDNSISALDEFSGGTEVTAAEVKKNLQSQIDGISDWSENMQTLAAAAGEGMTQEIYDALAEMGPESANLVQTLVDTLESDTGEFAEICASWAEAMKLSDNADVIASYTSVGEGIAETTRAAMDTAKETAASGASDVASEAGGAIASGTAEAISGGSQEVADAAEAMADEGAQAVAESSGDYEKAGSDAAKAVGDGIEAGTSSAVAEAYSLAAEVLDAARSNLSNFTQAGKDMASGLASGISANSSLVSQAARNAVKSAVNAAKDEGQISSPSKVFRDKVGIYLAQGMAQGILKGRDEVDKSSREVANASLEAMQDELGIHSPSQVFMDAVGVQISEGVAFGIKAKKGKAINQCRSLAEDVYDEASQWFENYKVLHEVSLEDEEYYWEQVSASLKMGTQAWYDAQKELKEIREEIAEEAEAAAEEAASAAASIASYNIGGSALSAYKTYFNVSAKAEMQYWDILRQQYAEGTAERLEADQAYYEAAEEYYSGLAELQEDYADEVADINEQLEDEIEELTETYTSAYDDAYSSIRNTFNLFDEFSSESVDGETLLANLQSQVQGYALWMEQLTELEERGILSSGLMDELTEQGADAAASIVALNQLTDEQLAAYQEAYDQKNALAAAQAAKETEALRASTEEAIHLAQDAATAEINTATDAFNAALAEMTADMDYALMGLANAWGFGLMDEDQVAAYLGLTLQTAGFGSTPNEIAEVSASMQEQMETVYTSLEAQAETAGQQMLAGLLSGMSDSLTITQGAESIVGEMEDAIKAAAGIASPSRRFRDEVGKWIPAGIAEGMEEGQEATEGAAADVVQSMLDEARAQMDTQRAQLESLIDDINSTAALGAVDAAISASYSPAVNVVVDNSALEDMVSGMADEIRELKGALEDMGVYLDGDLLVGGTSERMGDALTGRMRRVR